MEWQPIETAPRDGRRILLYGGQASDGTAYENSENIMVAGWHQLGGDGGSWLVALTIGGYDAVTYETAPTHWMPLPAPPVQP